MANILRGNRIKKSSAKANEFTSSVGFDAPLMRHVVEINLAHMLALVQAGEVQKGVASANLRFLASLPPDYKMDPTSEDVHHSLEQDAIKSIGMDKAGYLNLGKSRNDQVATAIRMETRAKVLELLEEVGGLQKALVKAIAKYGSLPMPGYTHLQRAQPTTVGHHLQSHFEALSEDAERLQDLYPRVNLSPMGAAAFAGTSFSVDRARVASLLGFDGLVNNSMLAVSSRGFVLEALSCLAILMVDLSKMAEELILWSTAEFGFVELGDEYSATSSIMPQKKNPVVAETIRAKCGSVMGEAVAAFAIAKSLPNSYNLDLQEVTPHLWHAAKDAIDSVSLMGPMLASAKFNKARLATAVNSDASTATELANELVRAKKVPFRQAHHIVGELVSVSIEKHVTLADAAERYLPEVSKKIAGRPIKLDKDRLRAVLDALKTLELIHSTGGANPRSIQRQLVQDKRQTAKLAEWVSQKERRLTSSRRSLDSEVRANLKREVRS